jgi:hypothetical protein
MPSVDPVTKTLAIAHSFRRTGPSDPRWRPGFGRYAPWVPGGISPVERRTLFVGLAALAAILVAAVVIAVVVTGPGRGAEHVASAPRDGRRSAVLDLVSGVGEVTVRATDLGDRLYRISTPDGSGLVPRVDERDGVATVRLDPVGGDGPPGVEILLSSAVTWTVRMDGGASALRMDLRDGPVAGVDAGGALLGSADPSGGYDIDAAGGVSTLRVDRF